MKVMMPEKYRLETNEFDDIKTSLYIDEKQLYFSKLLGYDVVFEAELRNQISEIIKNGDEPFIEFIDGKFDIRAIEID